MKLKKLKVWYSKTIALPQGNLVLAMIYSLINSTYKIRITRLIVLFLLSEAQTVGHIWLQFGLGLHDRWSESGLRVTTPAHLTQD